MTSTIPLYKPQNTIGAEVLDGIREVLESGWLTMGPKTIKFEEAFANYIGCKYGVATDSCTAALYCSGRTSRVPARKAAMASVAAAAPAMVV